MQEDIISIFKRIRKVIPAVGFVLILFYILSCFNISEILNKINNLERSYLLIAFALSCSQIIVATLRFYLFLRSSNNHYTFRICLKAVCNAIMYNCFLPSKAGDFLKVIVLTNNNKKRIDLSYVVLCERIIDIFSLVLVALIGLITAQRFYLFIITLGSLVLLIVLSTTIFYFSKKWKIEKFTEPLRVTCVEIRNNIQFSFLAFLICLLFWSINITIISTLFLSAGINLSLNDTISFWPISIIIGLLPISISGFGSRDIAFISLIDMPEISESVLTATFLYTANLYWLLGIISAIIIVLKKFKNE